MPNLPQNQNPFLLIKILAINLIFIHHWLMLLDIYKIWVCWDGCAFANFLSRFVMHFIELYFRRTISSMNLFPAVLAHDSPFSSLIHSLLVIRQYFLKIPFQNAHSFYLDFVLFELVLLLFSHQRMIVKEDVFVGILLNNVTVCQHTTTMS